MPKTRFPIRDLQGFDPAIEHRSTDKTHITEGRNFLWDSKGPKSGFGTRLLAGTQVLEPPNTNNGFAQSIEIGRQRFVFTSSKAWMLNDEGTSFVQIYDFVPTFGEQQNLWKKKWTAAYLSKGIYFAHHDYGLYKLRMVDYEYILEPRDQDDIPGIPANSIAVCEVSGRLVILDRRFLSWSAPNDDENFTPALGGAGFQELSDRVSGRPLTISAFQGGCLVWTEDDCLIVEFIGGDNVFRYDRMKVKQIPLNAWCVEDLPDGSQLVFSKQGVHRTSNASEPETLTPIFNEFIRKRLNDRPHMHVRINYVMEQDLLYVQLRDHTNHYVETYVLSVALDRWGVFNDRHFGVIRFWNRRGAFGYVDDNGIAHRFVEHFYSRETTPGQFIGLDALLEIGYIKPPELHGEIDTLLEMQEILVGGYPSRPAEYEVVDLGFVTFSTGACDVYNLMLDFDNGIYRQNGVPMSIAHWSSTMDPFDWVVSRGAQITTNRIIKIDFPALIFDMSEWEVVYYCVHQPGIINGVPGAQYFNEDLFNCIQFQAPGSMNMDECTRLVDHYTRYPFLGNIRVRTLARWQKKAEFPDCGPIPTEVDQEPYIRAALECGLTMIFDIDTSGGFGPLMTIDDTEVEGVNIRLFMTDTDSVTLQCAAVSVNLSQNSPEAIATGIYKIGCTIMKTEPADMVTFALSVNGEVAVVSDPVLVDPLIPLTEAMNFWLGHNPSNNSFLGSNIWLRRLDVFNAVDATTLAILTA